MLTLKKGTLLIANPGMDDPNFFKTVILITHYDKEESIGLILNHNTNIELNELIKDDIAGNFPIYIGGPVANQSIHYIHTIGNNIKNSTHIIDNLYWGGDFEEIKKLIKKRKILTKDIRFFCGYSGWTSKQLNDELKEGSWVLKELDIKLYDKYYNKKGIWRDHIKKIKKYAIWSNMPKNPNLN